MKPICNRPKGPAQYRFDKEDAAVAERPQGSE